MKAKFTLFQACDCLLILTGIKSEFHSVHSKIYSIHFLMFSLQKNRSVITKLEHWKLFLNGEFPSCLNGTKEKRKPPNQTQGVLFGYHKLCNWFLCHVVIKLYSGEVIYTLFLEIILIIILSIKSPELKALCWVLPSRMSCRWKIITDSQMQRLHLQMLWPKVMKVREAK